MKRFLSLALLLSLTASAFADEAEINGLWYNLEGNEASVIQTIMGLDGTMHEEPETPKCATPTIAFEKDGLVFSCETPDADIAYEITDSDIKKGFANGNKVSLTPVYTITYYAMKAGYENSDVATAIIRWRNGSPVYQGFSKVDPGEGAVWGDLNIDGVVDVADIANIIDIMISSSRRQSQDAE